MHVRPVRPPAVAPDGMWVGDKLGCRGGALGE